MKKFFVSMAMLLAASTASVFADGLTATVQSGDKLQPFYGVDAFKQAYEAADSGAVITLSAGRFNNVDTIAKPMTVIGSYAFDSTSVEATLLVSTVITADEVTIEGINFAKNVTLGNISNCKIAHSWIEDTLKYTSTEDWHTNTLIDQCVVKYDAAIKQSKNYTVKNTTLTKFVEVNTSDNIAYIANCVVYDFVYNLEIPTREAQTYVPDDVPIAIYRNNLLAVDISASSASTYNGYEFYFNVFMNAPSEFYYNKYMMYTYSHAYKEYRNYGSSDVYYNSGCQNEGNSKAWFKDLLGSGSLLDTEVYPASPSSPGNGQDGTPCGPQGGTGFSEYPGIPRITSKSIDSHTDATGKLNVKITVKAQ